MKNKIICLLLAMIMCFGCLVACKDKDENTDDGNSNTTQSQNTAYGQPSYTQPSFQTIDTPDEQLPF